MKLTAPFCSLEASGTFANAITAGVFHGRQWVKKKPRHTSYPSAQQRSNYAKLAALKRGWTYLDFWAGGGNKAAWLADPLRGDKSAFHHYMSTNLNRWYSGLGPVVRPGLTTDHAQSLQQNQRVGFHGYAMFNYGSWTGITLTADIWLVILYGLNGAAPTGLDSEILYVKVQEQTFAQKKTALVQPLKPGVWSTGARGITVGGIVKAFNAMFNVTVT